MKTIILTAKSIRLLQEKITEKESEGLYLFSPNVTEVSDGEQGTVLCVLMQEPITKTP